MADHLLARCAYVEYEALLSEPFTTFAHADELCVQLYMDSLGHGINGASLG